MPPDTFIALLRGINVGGRNLIPMAGLKTLCSELGLQDVRTYIQSGNVVFHAAGTVESLADALEDAIEGRFGIAPPVVVRTAADWGKYRNGNPFPEESESQASLVMIALSRRPPKEGAAEVLQERATSGERVRVVGDAVWIHFPVGAGLSKLTPGLLDRHIGSPVTTRNWRTVVKLDELAADLAGI